MEKTTAKISSTGCLKVPARRNISCKAGTEVRFQSVNSTGEYNWWMQKRKACRELFF